MRGAKVLDSWALLCYLEKEPGHEKVLELFKQATITQSDLFLCVVNWGETLYIVEKRYGEKRRDEIEDLLSSMHIQIVDADAALTRQAASFKARMRMSYADCFAAALAKLKKAELVTGDKDFKQIEQEVKIGWL